MLHSSTLQYVAAACEPHQLTHILDSYHRTQVLCAAFIALLKKRRKGGHSLLSDLTEQEVEAVDPTHAAHVACQLAELLGEGPQLLSLLANACTCEFLQYERCRVRGEGEAEWWCVGWGWGGGGGGLAL
mgnify:CR=1 FL=1